MSKKEYNNFNIENIRLERDSHTYILENNQDIEFTSVTTFLSDFFEKFDSEKIAKKLVNRVPKYAHLTAEELIGQWNEARDHGTKVHNEIEDYLLEDITPTEIKATNAIDWLNKNSNSDDHVALSEKIIYSEELKLAGSIDLIIHNKKTDRYSLVDWKTNAKITTNSFNGKSGTHTITSDLEDCKYTLYALQLSLYRYILEEYYGLNIYRQFIVHLKENETVAYLTPYYKKHVQELTNLRKI